MMRAWYFIAFLLFPTIVSAWDNTGHEVVAGIAWDNMQPAVRVKAIALLQGATDDDCLKALFPTDSRPRAEREREFFIRAATWPDIIRDGDCEDLSHPNWHFADHFWKGFSGGTGANAPHDAGKPTPSPNAIEQLTTFRDIVPCKTAPCAANAERAEDLAWILHLVGDVHQPLHNAARITTQSPKGDRGGNDFHLEPDDLPLHTYWDHIIDNSVAIRSTEKGHHQLAYIKRLITMIEHDHPRESMANDLQTVDFAAWSAEGFKTAEEMAYPESLKPNEEEHPAPTEMYRKEVFAACDRAIALAGYRLADLLTHMLTP